MVKREKGVGKKRLIQLIVVAAVLGLITYGYNQLQSPSVGVIQTVVPQEDVKAAEESPLRLDGETLVFSYPSSYGNTQTTAPNNQIVEQYSFTARNGVEESRRISVTVKQALPGEDMTDDSAYQFRENQTDVYTKTAETVGGVVLSKFEKSDRSEITYFYPGSGYYAIVAGTSTNNRGGLKPDVNLVINSLKWQK